MSGFLSKVTPIGGGPPAEVEVPVARVAIRAWGGGKPIGTVQDPQGLLRTPLQSCRFSQPRRWTDQSGY